MSIAADQFILEYKALIEECFLTVDYRAFQTILPDAILHKLRPFMSPLILPKSLGGVEGTVRQLITFNQINAYHCLPFALLVGVNGGLFLMNMLKYCADPQLLQEIAHSAIHQHALGGLMLTEPDHGAVLYNMSTYFEKFEDKVLLKGKKHWQGLSGHADHWLVAAREKKQGKLSHAMSLFYCPSQFVHLEEAYPNLGNCIIPYGLNRVEAEIPDSYRLRSSTLNSTQMFSDILYRSRLMMVSIAEGFLRRVLEEIQAYSQKRIIYPEVTLSELELPQYRIATIQSSWFVANKLCDYVGDLLSVHPDLHQFHLESSSIKAVITDLMVESVDMALQLMGPNGYRLDSVIGRGFVDARPFQILEGSNDILYMQNTDTLLYQTPKELTSLGDKLNAHPATQVAMQGLPEEVFQIETTLIVTQPQKYAVGKAIGYIVVLGIILADETVPENWKVLIKVTFRHKINLALCAYQTMGTLVRLQNMPETI